jgi:tetratricopeptide (TPR) repeat protein
VKIDRAKLNTLLRSGLNPDIKTRKQLAANLGMDPTSITRWFSNRDRLGNPRYPVVPDRHVTLILQIFKLDPISLSLSDDEFRRHCFELSLARADENSDAQQKVLTRMENIAQRRLTIPDYGPSSRKKPIILTCAITILGLIIWLAMYENNDPDIVVATDKSSNSTMKCWTGYSSELGTFAKEDKADPCHYGKLFHNALALLKNGNKSEHFLQSAAARDYMLFLSQSLDQRRRLDKGVLNMELGRVELQQHNYPAAFALFQTAIKELVALPEQSVELLLELNVLIGSAIYAKQSWQDARQSYEYFLLSEPFSGVPEESTVEVLAAGLQWRKKALSAMNNGNLTQAHAHIESALQEDLRNFRELHFSLASNWLVLSQIHALQGEWSAAGDYLQRAIALDIQLFGEQHPRVAQDKLILTLLTLREGNVTEALHTFKPLYALLTEASVFEQSGTQIGHWLHVGLNHLNEVQQMHDQAARSELQTAAWSNLSRALTQTHPIIPKQFAANLFTEIPSLSSQ